MLVAKETRVGGSYEVSQINGRYFIALIYSKANWQALNPNLTGHFEDADEAVEYAEGKLPFCIGDIQKGQVVRLGKSERSLNWKCIHRANAWEGFNAIVQLTSMGGATRTYGSHMDAWTRECTRLQNPEPWDM